MSMYLYNGGTNHRVALSKCCIVFFVRHRVSMVVNRVHLTENNLSTAQLRPCTSNPSVACSRGCYGVFAEWFSVQLNLKEDFQFSTFLCSWLVAGCWQKSGVAQKFGFNKCSFGNYFCFLLTWCKNYQTTSLHAVSMSKLCGLPIHQYEA